MKELAETGAQVLIQHIRNDLPQVQSTAAATIENEEVWKSPSFWDVINNIWRNRLTTHWLIAFQPMLEVTNVSDIEVVSGVEDIYKHLQTLNQDVRSGHQVCSWVI